MDLSDQHIRCQLSTGLALLPEVAPSEALLTGLCTYLHELGRWNKAYNLTAVRDPAAMVRLHVFDSLSVLPYVSGKRLLDVGTGAGLPGIPLALCMPASQFVLLDSNGKKIRFVEHVAAAMGLDNVVPVQVRAETYSAEPLFDSIVSRAYSSLHDFVTSSGRLVAQGGQLVAMKGKHPQAELAAVPDNWQVTRLEKLSVPDVDADRHIVVLQRA